MGKKHKKNTGPAGTVEDKAPKAGGRFPEWFDLLAMIAIFLGAILVAALCLAILQRWAPGMEQELRTAIVYALQFSLAIGGIYAYRRSRGATRSVFRFSIKWYNASLVLLGLILMLAGSVVLEPILNLFPDHYFETLNDAVGSGGWSILLTVLLAPVFEEMLFRGLVLESARQKWGATTAILLSAALFGLVHFPILPQMLNAFVMGVMLGYVYVLTDSLLSVIIIHAANNALAYLFLEITGTQNTDLREMLANDTMYWVVYAVCLVVFAVALVSMAVVATEKRRKRSEITAVFAAAPAENTEDETVESNNNG